MLLLLSHVSCVRLCDPIDGSPWGSHPWDSPGKNTGVGCHFLLQCMKVKSESEVAQSFLTLRDPMGCSLPGSSVHGIFQARVLEWVAIAFSGDTTGILSSPLALFVVMLLKAHLTSHSRMSGSRWVWLITPSWLSGSWRSVLYSSSVYSCHLFLISSASVSFC